MLPEVQEMNGTKRIDEVKVMEQRLIEEKEMKENKDKGFFTWIKNIFKK